MVSCTQVAWPTHTSTEPVDEFTISDYLARVYPTLFPFGDCQLRSVRRITVTADEYALHLMRHKSGLFARHRQVRYTFLNSIQRWRVLSLSKVYVERTMAHKTVADIQTEVGAGRDNLSLPCLAGRRSTAPLTGAAACRLLRPQVDAGNTATLDGLVRWAASVRGTKGYWQSQQCRGYAFLEFAEYFYDSMPTVFTTISAAELHWEWLHRLMPGSEEYLAEDHELTPQEEYRKRSEACMNNPGVMSLAFHLFVKAWLLQVMYPYGGWLMHLLRCASWALRRYGRRLGRVATSPSREVA